MGPWLPYPRVPYAKKVLSGKKKKICPRVALVSGMRVRYKKFFFVKFIELIKLIKIPFRFYQSDEN
jgi:hypothetical protein